MLAFTLDVPGDHGCRAIRFIINGDPAAGKPIDDLGQHPRDQLAAGHGRHRRPVSKQSVGDSKKASAM